MAAINITRENFTENVTEGTRPALIEFWAPWCTYCRRIGPAFDKVAEQYQDSILVGKLNIDEEPELAEEFKVEVIPTLIMYKGGKPAESIVAPDSKAKIDEFIKSSL